MNKKEISELRRRFSPDKNSIGRIYGCYVNTKKEIIAYLDESLAAMPPEEAAGRYALPGAFKAYRPLLTGGR